MIPDAYFITIIIIKYMYGVYFRHALNALYLLLRQ